jgi:hypothetical protein
MTSMLLIISLQSIYVTYFKNFKLKYPYFEKKPIGVMELFSFLIMVAVT